MLLFLPISVKQALSLSPSYLKTFQFSSAAIIFIIIHRKVKNEIGKCAIFKLLVAVNFELSSVDIFEQKELFHSMRHTQCVILSVNTINQLNLQKV